MAYQKKDQVISIRLPEEVKLKLEKIARKNDRSLQNQVLKFIKVGFHWNDFKSDD